MAENLCIKYGSGGGISSLKAIFLGTSYGSPKGRLMNEDGTTTEIVNGQSVSCNYFSISIAYNGGHATITRTATDSTKVYVLNIRQTASGYMFKELTNDAPTCYQSEDGPYTVVAF